MNPAKGVSHLVHETMSLVDKRFVLKPRRPISVIAIAMK
jgi:hypothetical protein